MAPTRIALVGYGLAGRVLHRPLISVQKDLTITQVVTADPERRAQAAADLPTATVLTSVVDLWSRSDEFDAVVIATPNDTHVPIARTAMSLGKATVLDKPVATTAALAASLAQQAAQVGVVASAFHNRRWDSDTLTAAALIGQGRLGTVTRLESRFARFRPAVAHRWKETAEAGGGVLLDLGSHLVDQAVHLLGPVLSVYAEIAVLRPGAVVDDDCFVALAHESGARSHLWMSLLAPRPGPRLVVQGTAAAFAKESLDGQEDALRAGWVPGQAGGPVEAPGTLYDGQGGHPVTSVPGDWSAFYRCLAAALREGGDPPVPLAEAVRVLQVLDAAVRSARDGGVVAV